MRALNTADVFAFARVIHEAELEKTLIDEFGDLLSGKKEIKKEDITETAEANQIGILFAIISAFSKRNAEKQFYEFLSGPFEMAPEQIKNQDPFETIEMIKKLTDSDGWKRFFNYAANMESKMHD